MRGKCSQARHFRQLPLDPHAAAITDREAALGAQPDPVTDLVLPGYPRKMQRGRQVDMRRNELLFGERRGLDLQQEVGRLRQDQIELHGNIELHRGSG